MKIVFFKWPDLSGIKRRWNYLKISYLTLTYNTYSSASDIIFEPIITLVDFMARWFGFAFVTLVTILIPYVVVAYYLMAVPYITDTYSFLRAAVTIFYGHYLLVMISFHYFKAVRTDPGRPPKDASDRAVTSVCKKCILPKPPRTHHCSVCKNCVLKMDHHCPWINNCVGHFNHRYFISFCIFMWLGTVFVITTTWPLFYDCFNVSHKARFTRDWITSIFVSLPKENEDDTNILKHDIEDPSKLENNIFSKFGDAIKFPKAEQIPLQPRDLCYNASSSYRTNVIFLWLLCFGVTGALGTLTAVQFRLVSHGETSIEKLINEKEHKKARKLGLKYQNPYHLGFIGNWKMLLNFHDLKSFFWNVLLPRVSLPIGDGLVWDKHINSNYSDEMYSNGH